MLIEIRNETGQYSVYAFWRHPVQTLAKLLPYAGRFFMASVSVS